MKTTKISIFILVVVLIISCFEDRSPEEMESSISQSAVMMRVNKLCSETPKPLDFRFIRKKIGGNSGTAALVFNYFSKMSSAQVRMFYSKWAQENGWQAAGENEYVIIYKKNNQTVVFEFGQFGPSNIAMSCEEER